MTNKSSKPIYTLDSATALSPGPVIEIPLEDAFPSLSQDEIDEMRRPEETHSYTIVRIDPVLKTIYLSTMGEA